MFLSLSPLTGCLLGLILIMAFIWIVIKSVGRKMPSTDPDFDGKYKEVMKNMGPMTWQERIVSVILITAFVALVVWIASIT